MDLAQRTYNHNWKIDPSVRSLLDTDFYKMTMSQAIFRHHPDVEVEFRLKNRTKDVNLAKIIDTDELRSQLDHARALRLTMGESTWMRGNTFYGRRNMFDPDFMEFMENLELPPYNLELAGDGFELSFKGKWAEVMHWEIPALSIINDLRTRAVTRNMSLFDLQILYARAMTRVWEKIERLKKLDGLKIADFGSRRRFNFLWQQFCVQAMAEGLGPEKFIGTSNCLLAMQNDLVATGTNAHELVQTYAALAGGDDELFQAPYKVLEDWQHIYHQDLRIILPDTYGTKLFFENAPDWVADWKGARVDSGDPDEIADFIIDWWHSKGKDPASKMLIFSDGLDVDEIERLHGKYAGKVMLGFGWGTLLTCDFRGLVCDDAGTDPLAPISLVCKVASVNGRPAVKLSDNAGKAMGPPAEVARYRRVFGNDGAYSAEVVV